MAACRRGPGEGPARSGPLGPPARPPIGRLGEPGEVARVETFLADPESGYITGEISDINGGLYR